MPGLRRPIKSEASVKAINLTGTSVLLFFGPLVFQYVNSTQPLLQFSG